MLRWARGGSARHHALAQTADADESVEVQSATSVGVHSATSVDGTNSPGCCMFEFAGEKLLLSSNRQSLSVRPLSALGLANESGDDDPLSVTMAPGHDISCFLKVPTRTAIYSGSYAGEVREPLPKSRWHAR